MQAVFEKQKNSPKEHTKKLRDQLKHTLSRADGFVRVNVIVVVLSVCYVALSSCYSDSFHTVDGVWFRRVWQEVTVSLCT